MLLIFRALLLTLLAFPVLAQDDVHITPRIPPASEKKTMDLPAADETLKKNVNLALIPLSVVDIDGRPFLGLQKDHFRLKENGVEIPIQYFSVGDAPCSIGIVFDRSGSMGEKLQAAKEAVRELVKIANPQDEFFMVTFADTIEDVTDWTNGDDLTARLTFTTSKGRTSLLDAVVLATNKMKEQSHYDRRALIIISDGGDNRSRYTEGYVKNLVQEANVMVFSMGLLALQLSPHLSGVETTIQVPLDSHEAELIQGPYLLDEIAKKSGGQLFVVAELRDVNTVARYISSILRMQYVLGYKPKHMLDDGKFRKVKVELVHLPKTDDFGHKLPLPLHIENVKDGIYARVEE